MVRAANAETEKPELTCFSFAPSKVIIGGKTMRRIADLAALLRPSLAAANPPVASYIFPAGAQRGTKVNVRVGGLFLHDKCGFEMLGAGVTAPAHLTRTKTTWFEGPLL